MLGEAVVVEVSAYPHDKEENHGNVGGEELAGGDAVEGLVALHKHKQESQTEGVVGHIWHAPSLERQHISGDISLAEDSHETDVRERDVDPGNETRDGSNVQQPVENGVSAAVKNEVAQGTEGSGEKNSHVWNALGSSELEPLWSSVDMGQTVQNSGATVDVGATSGDDGNKNHSVENARQDLGTRVVHGHNERR